MKNDNDSGGFKGHWKQCQMLLMIGHLFLSLEHYCLMSRKQCFKIAI